MEFGVDVDVDVDAGTGADAGDSSMMRTTKAMPLPAIVPILLGVDNFPNQSRPRSNPFRVASRKAAVFVDTTDGAVERAEASAAIFPS